MPEIKKQFTKGKMNKDLDERLVPNGEYRDAMNIQVATSEDSDVATAQNILGNKKITIATKFGDFDFDDSSVVVGAVADEKVDTLYWLVWSTTQDVIISFKRGDVSPKFVFVDIKNDGNEDVLKFDKDNLITGINVVDGMMLWTDNINEPRKINIERCTTGTDPVGVVQTKLINKSIGLIPDPLIANPFIGLPDVEEKHITVIKKAPTAPLKTKLNTWRDSSEIYSCYVTTTVDPGPGFPNDSSFGGFPSGWGQDEIYDFSIVDVSDPDSSTFVLRVDGLVDMGGNMIPGSVGGLTGLGATANSLTSLSGTKVVLKAFSNPNDPPGIPVTDYDLKGIINDAGTTNGGFLEIEFTSVTGSFPPQPGGSNQNELQFVIDRFEEDEKLFEFKFPRFSYRYKYEDGEYSPYAPFTQVAFVPGSFDYHPRKGYNIGMTNTLKSIDLSGCIHEQMPKDVVSVDILFKDEPSPAIYVVDTIRPDDNIPPSNSIALGGSGDNIWNDLLNGGWYNIEKETVDNILPANQLLRPWDNVPRRALAQDVTGNRVVYGNYVQNYDLLTINGNKYFADFKPGVREFSSTEATEVGKSCKSLREYQLGVVFIDKYGRETPIISNRTGTIKIEKDLCAKNNRLKIGLKGYAPDNMPQDMTYMKFFVKETSNEYYNLAMDRWYDAEDGNIWLAFPSSDRNKVDIDTFLILKKGSDSDDAVFDQARYNILAIEAEAPEFIKTSKLLYSRRSHYIDSTLTNPAGIWLENELDIVRAPLRGRDTFSLRYAEYDNSSGSALHKYTDGELWVEFENAGGTQVSDRYRISNITCPDCDGGALADETYDIRLEKKLGDDVNFITDDPSGANPSTIESGTIVNIYKYKPENLPQFDGRFFVKIYKDEVFNKNIQKTFIGDTTYRIVDSRPVYYLQKGYTEKFTKYMNNWFTPSKLWYTNAYGGYESDYGTIDVTLAGLISPYRFKSAASGHPKWGAGGEFVSRYSGHNFFVDDDWSEYCNGDEIKVWLSTEPWYGLYDYPFANDHGGSSNGNIHHSLNHYGWMLNNKFCAAALWFTRYLPADQITGDATYEDEIWRVATYNGSSNDSKDAPHLWEAGKRDYMDKLTSGFRGRMSHACSEDYPGVVIERVDYDLEVSRDAEVWFIDHGRVRGRRWDDNVAWNKLAKEDGVQVGWTTVKTNDEHNPNAAQDDNNYYGFTKFGDLEDDSSFGPIGLVKYNPYDYWQMQLSFGGIAGSNGYDANSDYNKNFYNIAGVNAANPANLDYMDSTLVRQCAQLVPGKKFRWRNDPTETIYTIISPVSRDNFLRHSTWRAWANDGETYNDGYLLADNMAPQSGINHTKSFQINRIEPKLTWDPTEYGEITGGLQMKLTICDINGNTSGAGLGRTTWGDQTGPDGSLTAIYVTSLKPTVSNTSHPDKNPPLHVGMALKRFERVQDSSGTLGGVISTISGVVEKTEDYGTGREHGLVESGNDYLVVRYIAPLGPDPLDGTIDTTHYALILGGYDFPMQNDDHKWLWSTSTQEGQTCPKAGGLCELVQVGMNGQSPNSAFNINENGYYITNNEFQSISSKAYGSDEVNDQKLGKIGYVGYDLEFIEEVSPTEVMSENPAIWETEPKEDKDLEIYYEATGAIPFAFDETTIHEAFPIGSTITPIPTSTGTVPLGEDFEIIGYQNNRIILNLNSYTWYDNISPTPVNIYRITTPSGLTFGVEVINQIGSQLEIDPYLYNANFELSWHNCYSFGNGVESNRIRDNYNLAFISNGVKVSAVLEQEYEEEHRKYGLIYSGIYNSNSGINNLNQFIQAEKITKDVNPIYGSIQKLHSRNSDLVTLCEDKVLKILANKDALYNADGKTNLTATENVLGQTVPFSGEYGISKNPESFASEAYRAYFTDKVRGVVMRLSKDGLTPISEAGMKDWFRDNLKLVSNNNKIIGSYDDRNDEYNIKLEIRKNPTDAQLSPRVVTYSEKVKGWVSFKSFVDMSNAISMGNDYYTFFQGDLYKHYDENVERNTFYGNFISSSLEVVLNDNPSVIKNFNTLNYEGSQSKIDMFTSNELNLPWQPATIYDDQAFYNLTDKEGWYVENVFTDKEDGYINEFIEKEGKWFNNINRRIDLNLTKADASDFTFQGIGVVSVVTTTGGPGIQCPHPSITQPNLNGDLVFYIPPPDPSSPIGGYNSYSWTLQGPSIGTVTGSTGTLPSVTTNDLLANGNGMYTFTVDFLWENTSCQESATWMAELGCADPNAINYDPYAEINVFDPNSCDYYVDDRVYGCTNPLADNYDPLATVDDGSCQIGGCTNPNASNYDPLATYNDGSCLDIIDPIDDFDTGRCEDYPGDTSCCAKCDDSPHLWGACAAWCQQWGDCCSEVYGCTDPEVSNYDPFATIDDGSCCVDGCTDPIATNYNPLATCNDGSCKYTEEVWGCTDPDSDDYNPLATHDDGSCTYSCTQPQTKHDGINITTNSATVGWSHPETPFFIINISVEGKDGYKDTFNFDGVIGHNEYNFSDLLPNTKYAVKVKARCLNGIVSPWSSFIVFRTLPERDIITGCTDPLAGNYDPMATVDDGSCVYRDPRDGPQSVFDEDQINWTDPCPNADVEQAKCEEGGGEWIPWNPTERTGCRCVGERMWGCTDRTIGLWPDINGNSRDGTPCIYPCESKKVENGYRVKNYDPAATVDDGSCMYDDGPKECAAPVGITVVPRKKIEQGDKLYDAEIKWQRYDNSKNYKLRIRKNNSDWKNWEIRDNFLLFKSATVGARYFLEISRECVYKKDHSEYYVWSPWSNTYNFKFEYPTRPDEIYGCMDPIALNYNPFANEGCEERRGVEGQDKFWCCEYRREIEDEVRGCMDPKSINYNPYATIDDGSCIYNKNITTITSDGKNRNLNY